jgi:hypothetical protein
MEDAERIVLDPLASDIGPNGNPRYLGYAEGRLFRVVVAKDDKNVIVTAHPRRHL